MERDPLTGGPLPMGATSRAAAARGEGAGRRRRVAVVAMVSAVVLGGAALWAWRRVAATTPDRVAPPSAVPEAASARADGAPPEGPPTRRIIVEVLNASGVRGLGRRATAYLRDQGLDVVYTANAPDSLGRDSTLVLDRVGDAAAAARVATAMGGARVAARPDTSRYVHVTVLVGRTWRPPADALYP